MQRREFIWILGGGVVACTFGCEAEEQTPSADAAVGGGSDDPGGGNPVTADAGIDACVRHVVMHDTYAQALYLDGTKGPLTGVIQVAYVIAGSKITLDFWHGHGGVQHRYTLEPSHFAELKDGKRITIGTTTVDGHAHTLFIDPRDETYRVPNAPDVEVPIDC